MKHNLKIFRLDLDDLHPVFCLRKLFVSDDSELLQQLFVGLADKEDTAEPAYRIKVAALAKWAMPWPDDYKGPDGKKVKRPDEALDSAELINTFFAEFNADNDVLSEDAISTMRRSPKRSFF